MSNTNDTTISQMERLTTCPVCLDKFRTPKLLPCMHTFCLMPCLTNLVEPRARSLRCPECRREHPIPPGGVQAFPMNLTMIGFLDLQSAPNTNPPDRCCVCQEQKQPLSKCHDCSKSICQDCREAHLRDAANHVHSLISQLRRALPQLSEKIASYEQRVNTVKVNHEQIEREISSAIANLMEELKHREKALYTEAEVHMQSQLRTFRLQQEAAEVELASVVSFCESFETSFSNGSNLNDVDLANMRQQCNRYTQQLATLQAQMPTDVQKLRFIANDQSVLSTTIQDFGRLMDTSRDQPAPFEPFEHRSTMPHYVSTIPSSMHNPTPSYHEYYQRLDDLYHGRSPAVPPASAETFIQRRRPNYFSGSVDNPFVDLDLTLRGRASNSSYRGSWETQTPHRSSSIFGPNPFASTTTASNSRQMPRPQEPEPAVSERPRRNTFVLEEPSVPNLPQSGIQRPQDNVLVQELYNVRPRDRAQTPVAFTIDMNEGAAATEATTSVQ